MIADLLPIGLLIVVARLLECLLDRIGLSSIVAYIAAGILLVPVAGIVEPTSSLQVFLVIGVFILFFLVGLDEIDFPRFVATLRGRFFCHFPGRSCGNRVAGVAGVRLFEFIFRYRYSRQTTDPHPAGLLNRAAS